MAKLTSASLQFLAVPPERLARIREIVDRTRSEASRQAEVPAGEFWKPGGIARSSMEEILKLLELPPLPVAIEKDTGTRRPYEYVTPPRMPAIVVVHPDVIDAVEDAGRRADLVSRLVFHAPLAHLAAHHAGKLNWKKAEEFFAWAAERAGL